MVGWILSVINRGDTVGNDPYIPFIRGEGCPCNMIIFSLVVGLAILAMPQNRRDWIRWTALGAALLTLLLTLAVYFNYSAAMAFSLSKVLMRGRRAGDIVLLRHRWHQRAAHAAGRWWSPLASWCPGMLRTARESSSRLMFLGTSVLGVFSSLDMFCRSSSFELAVFPKYLMIAMWGFRARDCAR